MHPSTSDARFSGFVKDVRSILTQKGAEYRGDSDDQLGNFRAAAKDLGISPLQVWWVYFFKQLSSVRYAVSTGDAPAEGLRSRFLDIAGYAFLGDALFAEELKRESEAQTTYSLLADAPVHV